MSATVSKRKNQKVEQFQRDAIIDMVDNRHLSITEAAKIVGLRYETAKSIHKMHQTTQEGKWNINLYRFLAPSARPLSFKQFIKPLVKVSKDFKPGSEPSKCTSEFNREFFDFKQYLKS